MVMALVHLTMDGESVSRVVVDVILLYLMDVRTQATDGETVRRVAADGISLYPRAVRTLVRCCIPISLSSAEGTIVAFALEWMSELAAELYGARPGCGGNRRKRREARVGKENDTGEVLASPTFKFANSERWRRRDSLRGGDG
jgi:hypothetical protein